MLDNDKYRMGESLGKIKDFADSVGIRIRYSLLWGSDKFPELQRPLVQADSYVDNILVYTYGDGEPEEQCPNLWGLDRPPWSTVLDQGDDVKQYQKVLSTRHSRNRGHVRVLRALRQRRHCVSSTEIRAVSLGHTDDELAWCHLLRRMALGWDVLHSDELWNTWHATGNEAHKGDSDIPQMSRHVCGESTSAV